MMEYILIVLQERKIGVFYILTLFTFEGKFFVCPLTRCFVVVVVVDINNKVYASIWIGRCKKGTCYIDQILQQRLKSVLLTRSLKIKLKKNSNDWYSIDSYKTNRIHEFYYCQSPLQNLIKFPLIQFLNCVIHIPFLHGVTLILLLFIFTYTLFFNAFRILQEQMFF